VCVTFFIWPVAVPLVVEADNLEDGRAAISSGDYTKALELLTPLADAGNAVAQNAMGVLYQQGWGVSPDPERAVSYFKLSAEQGNAKGAMNLAYAYRTGTGVNPSCTEACLLLEPHAQSGIAMAQVMLGAIYDEGCLDVPADSKVAYRWYLAAAEQGDPRGMGNVGAMYALGLGVDQSYSEAMKYYQKAVALGNGKAALNLGRMYEFGEGIPPDLERAKQLYRQAVELGELEAERRLMALEKKGKVSRVDTANLLAAAIKVPAADLAQSYGSLKNVITMLPLVESGATLRLPDGEVNEDNLAVVRGELEDRLAIFEQAIEKRGAVELLGEYVAIAQKCDYSGSSWASLIADGYDHVFVSQNGPEVTFEASKKRHRNKPERSATGYCVENAISLVDPMNSDYVLIGEFLDGLITIRPDVESILRAWPEFIQPPSRANLSSCVVKLAPVGNSQESLQHEIDSAFSFKPPTGKGFLFIHRAKKLAASEVTFRVELNDETVGPMTPNQYYRLDLEPGVYVVKVWSRDIQDNLSIGSLEIAVKPDKASFIEVKPKMGWKAFKMSVEEVPDELGQRLVLDGVSLN
jgi:hypothetical protein